MRLNMDIPSLPQLLLTFLILCACDQSCTVSGAPANSRQKRSMGGLRMGKRQDYTSSSSSDSNIRIVPETAVRSTQSRGDSNIGDTVERLMAALNEERGRQSKVQQLSNRIYSHYNKKSENAIIESTTSQTSANHQQNLTEKLRYLNREEILELLQEIRDRQYAKFGRL